MTDATLTSQLEADLAEAERKAWDSLARMKFWMFGYHAADVIKIKRRLGRSRETFFTELVMIARTVMAQRYGTAVACYDYYLIWSHHHGAWWGPDKAGYTTDLIKAGRYSREAAIDICAHVRDGYTTFHGLQAPTEWPVRLDAAVCCKPGEFAFSIVRPEDDTECRQRDLARKGKVAA